MNPDWVQPLATEANRLGMRTVGHVPAFTTPDHMLEAGYNEITHINQLMLGWLLNPGEDTRTPLRLTAMARAADLDLSSAARLAHDRADEGEAGGPRFDDLDPRAADDEPRGNGYRRTPRRTSTTCRSAISATARRSYVNFKDKADEDRYDRAFAKVVEALDAAAPRRIPLLPGTDDTIGFSLHRELEFYVKAGMSPAEALRVATYDCDRYLGRDQLYGSIERGKQADFILTPGDPSQDIKALHSIRMVVKGGVVYFPSELHAALGIAPFATPPKITQPKSTAAAADVHLTGESSGRSAFAEEPLD